MELGFDDFYEGSGLELESQECAEECSNWDIEMVSSNIRSQNIAFGCNVPYILFWVSIHGNSKWELIYCGYNPKIFALRADKFQGNSFARNYPRRQCGICSSISVGIHFRDLATLHPILQIFFWTQFLDKCSIRGSWPPTVPGQASCNIQSSPA